ncbi:MAG TPA: hypothetical protein VJB14_01835, partial [Planctomycetota bacterium]|nr:hypothetical protein [Planctomycetota bacterium]
MTPRIARTALIPALAALAFLAIREAHRDPSIVPVAQAPAGATEDAPAPASVREQAPDEQGITLRSPEADLRASFDPGGIVVTCAGASDWKLRLRVTGIGRGGIQGTAARGAPAVEGGEVAYRHSWGREAYAERAGGIEQLFEVRERPAGEGPLEIHLEAEGLTVARVMRHKAVFASGTKAVLEYGKLLVLDAGGSAVPAEMAGGGGGIRLIIDDRFASYPLLVDPLLGP